MLVRQTARLALQKTKAVWAKEDRKMMATKVVQSTEKDEFDFVVVGAGSAGCTIAARLSENEKFSVCLLEAGPVDFSPTIHVPYFVADILGRDKVINWRFETEPQANLNNRTLYWPRGRTLGGSSSINAMVYIRGHPEDYNGWATQVAPEDANNWKYENVLKQFKKSERYAPLWEPEQAKHVERRLVPSEAEARQYHGTNGPLSVTYIPEYTHLSRVLINAAEQAGYPLTRDFNGEQQEGFGTFQVTQINGRRCSSARAFLGKTTALRENIEVYTNSHATRITFGSDGSANGVECVRNKKLQTIKARKEVIVAMGAVQSPQFLMLSGIGPKEVFDEFPREISEIKRLEGVGKNLQDHLDVLTIFREIYKDNPHSFGLSWHMVKRFLSACLGIGGKNFKFFSSNYAEVGGFLDSKVVEGLNRPDLQFHFVPGLIKDHGRQLVMGHGYSLHACDLLPDSRGHIGLRTANPLDAPIIQPNYLSHPRDIKKLVAAYRASLNIFQQALWAPHRGAHFEPKSVLQTDEEIENWIRGQAETVYHPVGSCKMGDTATDPTAVVDGRLRVAGVKGLRVADASIMPRIVAGNTNAPSIMIGEQCSSFIHEEYA